MVKGYMFYYVTELLLVDVFFGIKKHCIVLLFKFELPLSDMLQVKHFYCRLETKSCYELRLKYCTYESTGATDSV